MRAQLRGVRDFIAPSAFLRDQYVKQGFPGERIHVLENGVDLERLRGAADAEISLPELRPHFAFIGSLASQKGVDVLLRAFNRLPDAASLTIYGSELTFPEYVQQLKALAAHRRIRFAGALDHRHVGVALRQIDCLVVPSVWYENSPLVIQEAFAMGVPVVASRLGALEEKVKDGVTGRLFTPGNDEDLAHTLQELIGTPEFLSEYKHNIRPPITIQAHASAVESLYLQTDLRHNR